MPFRKNTGLFAQGDFIGRLSRDHLALNSARKRSLPPPDCAEAFIGRLFPLLFPLWRRTPAKNAEEIASEAGGVAAAFENMIAFLPELDSAAAAERARNALLELPSILDLVLEDARAIFEGDPAAESLDEVILTYPGFLAIAVHRWAHALHRAGLPFLPRLFSEYAHRVTGIDIHPGARIGRSFCIDHGTGVVIGATAVIGDNVKIYQGVTLGALSVDKRMAREKRHPTIEDNVVIYAQAVILGGRTRVGHDSVIGGNVWLTRSVPPFSSVVHKKEIFIRSGSRKALLPEKNISRKEKS